LPYPLAQKYFAGLDVLARCLEDYQGYFSDPYCCDWQAVKEVYDPSFFDFPNLRDEAPDGRIDDHSSLLSVVLANKGRADNPFVHQ
jgi:hypothetical protein